MCGLRTGLAHPLPVISNDATVKAPPNLETFESDELDGAGDIAIAPPIERPKPSLLPYEIAGDGDLETQAAGERELVVRSVSLSNIMIGTSLVAVCLAVGRLAVAAGVIAFLILIPAFVRTLSAIHCYRQMQRPLTRPDIATVFVTSLVLAIMGLTAGGMVYAIVGIACRLFFSLAGISYSAIVATALPTAAAFVTVSVVVHRVWPVDQE
jgi:hypothetical protein